MHLDSNTRDVPRSSVDRAMCRRDTIALAILVALGLTSSDAGRRLANAAKKGNKKKEGASSSGREVDRVAEQYKGAKYTLGGASPKGFDCSGFTWYVYQTATGMDITRGVEEQWQLGRAVGHGEWQPGD